MKGQRWIAVAVLAAALAAAVTGAVWAVPAVPVGNVIALVRLQGPITTAGGAGFATGVVASSDRLVQVLKAVGEDGRVRALVLRVDSPGGSVPASFEIARAVRRLKEQGIPVVVSMGDVAASGGYYVASQADYIFATPGTLTGSIGVIMNLANLEELYRKIGYRPITIKSGEYKDIGSESREMTPEERAMLQAMSDLMYEQFLGVVAEGRKMPLDRVRELAEGKIYVGSQAVEVGLVDALGDLEDAYRKAAELAGLEEGDYTIEEFGRVTPLEEFLGLPVTMGRAAALLEEALGRLAGLEAWVPEVR